MWYEILAKMQYCNSSYSCWRSETQ